MKKFMMLLLPISMLFSCSKDRDDDSNFVSDTPIIENTEIDTNNIVSEVLRIPYQNGNKTINIYGVITAPQGYQNHNLPIVILSPGFGNNLEFMSSRYADRLARLGFITYSFDFYGAYNGSRSGGTMLEMSPFTEVEDLTAIVNAMSEKPFVDKNNIFLMGYSQGGVVSAITASENNDKIKGLILMNAALVLFDDARAEFSSVDVIPDIVHFRGATLGKIYFERSLNYDIYDILPDFNKKVLIIHGSNDNIVPINYAQRASTTYPNAQLEIIYGAGHIFSSYQDNNLFPFISNYLSNQIKE